MTIPTPETPTTDHGRAGRNLPVAIASGIGLLALVAASLLLWKSVFMVVVIIAVMIAVGELDRAFNTAGIDIPEQPVMIGGAVMLAASYLWGPTVLVAATAVTALVVMLWLMRRGIDGFVSNATASVFTLVYLPLLGSFVGLMLAEGGDWRSRGLADGVLDNGVRAIIAFILLTIASDIGGYAAGVLFGRHKMTPVISPKKSWEGFAGSVVFCLLVGVGLAIWVLNTDWWIGLGLGAIAVVMATMGDLIASVIKRDLGIKDMGTIIPGHGGLMDRIDSLLATSAPIWLVLHHAVF